MSGQRKPWHTGTHPKVSAAIRAAAWANPDTRCWRCNRTLAEMPLHRTGRRPWWTGGHINDGQVDGAELPECSHCATSTGARRGNRMRERRSRRWFA